jgi:hypothetical protein
MKPILKWQYDQLVKELLLLQEHQADPTCPCDTEKEMCKRKHLFAVEGYAEETESIADNEETRQMFLDLAMEARTRREQEEAHLKGEAESPGVLDWARSWRKHLSHLALEGTGSDTGNGSCDGTCGPVQSPPDKDPGA